MSIDSRSDSDNAPRNDNHGDTDNTAPRLTRERLVQQLQHAGHPTYGGLYTDERGAAWLLACSDRTLRNWRARGTGPTAYMTVRWLYPLDELTDWMESRAAGKFTGSKRKPPEE